MIYQHKDPKIIKVALFHTIPNFPSKEVESPPNDATHFGAWEDAQRSGEFLEAEWLIPTGKDFQFHNRVILYIHGKKHSTKV